LNLKRRCKIYSTLRPSRHNCKIIRLHVKTKESNTLSPKTGQFTTAKTVSTHVSLNMSSRAQKVCASNSAHPELRDRNNKEGKCIQPWNSAGHNCRNRLRLLPITSFRAVQACVQARSQVLRFGGAKYIFMGARFLFL